MDRQVYCMWQLNIQERDGTGVYSIRTSCAFQPPRGSKVFIVVPKGYTRRWGEKSAIIKREETQYHLNSFCPIFYGTRANCSAKHCMIPGDVGLTSDTKNLICIML